MTEYGSVIITNQNPYFKFSATLRIFGNTINFDDIAEKMKIMPTKVIRKGERKSSNSIAYKHDMWSYRSPVSEERPLDRHLDELWSRIKIYKHYLISLKELYTVDVLCSYNSDHGFSGFEITSKSLDIFYELDVAFGLSIIVVSQ